MKTAYLITVAHEKVVQVDPVKVDNRWTPSDGPYSYLVPFVVGSNQYIVEHLSDGELKALGDPLETHGLYRTYLEEFEGCDDQQLCEYVHGTVGRCESHKFLRLVWRSATPEEKQEFEGERSVHPSDPDMYRGYMITCCRLIDYLRENTKLKETNMQIARDKPRDYNRIHYYMDGNNNIWHGPFSPDSNTHYKQVTAIAVTHSDLPAEAVEITPYQAAQEIRRRQERLVSVGITSLPKEVMGSCKEFVHVQDTDR